MFFYFFKEFYKKFFSQNDNVCWGARSHMLPFVCSFKTIKTSWVFGNVLLQCFPSMSAQENHLCWLLKIQTPQPHPEIIYVRISGGESQPSIFLADTLDFLLLRHIWEILNYVTFCQQIIFLIIFFGSNNIIPFIFLNI